MNEEFSRLCEKCPRLKGLLKKQQTTGLSKDQWSAVVRLLVDAGRISLARKFSEQSEKHNYESEEYIDNLSVKRKGRPVRCTELGCTQEKIEYRNDPDEGCFGGEPCLKNENDEIINTPAPRMCLDQEEKEAIGFYLALPDDKKDNEADDEKKRQYVDMNPNIYVRHILKKSLLAQWS